jgi:hypothetical protein
VGQGVSPLEIQPQGTLVAFQSEGELRSDLRRHVLPPEPPHKMNPGEEIPGKLLISASLNWGRRSRGGPAANISPMDCAPVIHSKNRQEALVDEGDIAKLHGDRPVILRHGRLFMVSIANGGMRPINSIDAYAPGADARTDW